MNLEQAIQDIQKDIAVIKTKQNNDHARLEETKALSSEIHKMSINIGNLTEQIKGQNERTDKLINDYNSRLQNQGVRIGAVEVQAKAQEVVSETVLKRLDAVEGDVDGLKTKGTKRWDGVVEKIIFVVVGAGVMFVLSRLGL